MNTFKSDISALIRKEKDLSKLHLLLIEYFARYSFPVVSNKLKKSCRRCTVYPISIYYGASDMLIWCPQKNVFLTKWSPPRAHAYGWEWEGRKKLSYFCVLDTPQVIAWICKQTAALERQ
jgi:hypothetical protein